MHCKILAKDRTGLVRDQNQPLGAYPPHSVLIVGPTCTYNTYVCLDTSLYFNCTLNALYQHGNYTCIIIIMLLAYK